MPELLTFVLSLYPHLLEASAGMSLQHVSVQNGSLAALRALLVYPGVQVSLTMSNLEASSSDACLYTMFCVK